MIRIFVFLLIFSIFVVATSESQDFKKDEAAAKISIEAVLDDFHDAASKADEERYFSLFAPEGVFMGTDPDERWTVDQFRKWARPYFEDKRGWTFVPKKRFVFLSKGNDVAWFDEKLDNSSYGECRGTGVLRTVAGAWKVAHYNLTIPVPNQLAKDLVRKIRGEAALNTTVFIVRHAEKLIEPNNRDPDLSDKGKKRAKLLSHMLGRMKLKAAFATQYKRTQQTVAPSADAAGIETTVTEAMDMSGLAKRLKTGYKGESVLVSGHSNTVPALIEALGVKEKISIKENEYDCLYIVIVHPEDSPCMVRINFGDR